MAKKSLEDRINKPGSAYDLTRRRGPSPCIKPKLNYPGSAYDLTLNIRLRRYQEGLKRRYGKK
ncbi:hypothetical protein HOG16_03495 [Candidatus Woesearchaeota archaeon]|jgi:hypothetical protein|nr:hypothetical protein [Candidatus Woesearchaeota archaeon]MBT4321590.1 hypothetical protein [Candidatus Woesearchaeota archaeon]MBT4631099.1 hypothetical protein [Candidatus Woesearchaeota archaeon]